MPDIFTQKKFRAANAAVEDVSGQNVIDIQDATILSKQAVDKYSRILSRFPPTGNPLASFAPVPARTAFTNQMEGEQIVLLVRQHPASQLKFILIGLLLFFMPFVFAMTPIYGSMPVRFGFFFTLGWYLFWFGYSLEAFINWFFNVNIVTDERIIDIDFISLLFQDVSTTKLDKIEDVTSITAGTLGSIFDYGKVLVQTAGATDQVEFTNVPYPSQINGLINELLVKEEKEHIEAMGEAASRDRSAHATEAR